MASKQLLDLPIEEQRAFLNSFDTVFCDVDGVLWDLFIKSIEGTEKGIKALRKLGKKIYFVSNNSTAPLDLYVARMKEFEVVKEEVVRPSKALTWYLKKINFNKELYVVGFKALKDELRDAGFKVVSDEIAPIEETAEAIVKKLNEIRPDVGAIIIDFAVNVDYMSLQKCIEYINKNNALFLVGAWDPVVPYRGTHLIGASYLAKSVEDITGITPKILSKPGKEFNDIIQETIGPFNSKRVLFIGDSPVTDMAFATNCGYQKLLTLTGYTTKEDLDNWKFDEKYKPDYVVDSVKAFDTIIRNLELDKPKL